MYLSIYQHVHVGEGKKVRWTIASARQNLPTVIALAAREPQDVYRRDKLVARVISPDPGGAARTSKPPIAELLSRIQRVCADENYTLVVPPRSDRVHPFDARPAKPGQRRRRRP